MLFIYQYDLRCYTQCVFKSYRRGKTTYTVYHSTRHTRQGQARYPGVRVMTCGHHAHIS